MSTAPLPDHLAHLREDFDPGRVEPITLRQRFGTSDLANLVLMNGNHRLRLARERGDRSIEAIVQIPQHCRE